jgi:hypothetical protein
MANSGYSVADPSEDKPDGQPPPSPGGEEQSDAQGADSQKEFTVQSDTLPAGMAETTEAGDVLEFKVVGKDAEGHLRVVYNTGDEGSKESPGDKMKADFREHMSGPTDGQSGGGY